jgi:hypothetical protein
MTPDEKLESFKRDCVGLYVRTEEIARLLGKALDTIGIKGNDGTSMVTSMRLLWKAYGDMCDVLYISVNHPVYHGLMCGYYNDSGVYLKEIYEVTKEELEEYLGKAGE